MTKPPSPDDLEEYRAFCEAHGFPYVPGFVQRMPYWQEPAAPCPYCYFIFEPAPARSGACPACGDTFYVRTVPDGSRRMLTRRAMIEVECLHAEEAALGQSIGISVGAPEDAAGAALEAREVVMRLARERVLAKYDL